MSTENIDSTEQHFDRFCAGVSRLADTPPDSGTYPIRGVALSEGNTATGLSGKTTYWDRQSMKAAVESGRVDTAKVLKGRGGVGHKPMEDLADPDNIVGSVEFDYEDGVGLVYEGELIDEAMANRVRAGLVEVSPDMFRELGEYDDDHDAYTVAELLAIPYITIVDRGAITDNSIEVSEIEAMSYADMNRFFDDDTAETDSLEEQAASSGDRVRWESTAGGESEPDDSRYGIVVDELQEGDDDTVLVAVYEPNSDGSEWVNRGEENPIQESELTVISSLPAISQVSDAAASSPADATESDPPPTETEAQTETDLDSDSETVEQNAPDVTIHSPSYSGTTDSGSWDRPAQGDFGTDDLSEIGQHFIASESGFPPENYGDLKIPVVSTDGNLSLPGLRAAISRLPQTGGLSDSEESEIRTKIENLANDEFDAEFGSDSDSESDQNADSDQNAQNSPSDESAESDIDSDADNESPPTTDMSTTESESEPDTDTGTTDEQSTHDRNPAELKEQLSDLRSETDSLEDELSEKETEIEQLSDRVDTLESELGPVETAFAERLAEKWGVPEDIVSDRFSVSEMIDLLTEEFTADSDASEQASEPTPSPEEQDFERRTEQVREQLAAPRGGHDEETEPAEQASDNESPSADEQAAADSLVLKSLGAVETYQVKNSTHSPSAYVEDQYGINPAEYDTDLDLRDALASAKAASADAEGDD